MKICIIDNCDNKSYAKDLCRKHYDQKNGGYGLFRKSYSGHIGSDPNEFVIEGKICKIFLYDRQGRKKAETIIDVEDYEKCKQLKWSSYTDNWGNVRVYNKKMGYLSVFIMGKTKGLLVDHKDGNTLDNRKQNLQKCTNQQNQMKSKLHKTNTSGYRGVHWHKETNKWIAGLNCGHIGSYETKEEAVLAYNKKTKELFGTFAPLNEIKGGEQQQCL